MGMPALGPTVELAAHALLLVLSSKAGRGAAIVTAILGQILLLAVKNPEDTLSGNRHGAGPWGQGGTWELPPGGGQRGRKHRWPLLSLHLLSPGTLFTPLLSAIVFMRWGAVGVPRAVLHCTPRHGCSILGEPGPALAEHRGLRQTPPEVPPSSAMCCQAPCGAARAERPGRGLCKGLCPSLPTPKHRGGEPH